MDILKMTDLEIYEMGLEELASQLGPAEKMRFLQQCKPSDYDYTAERHKWLANQPDIPTIAKRIQQKEVEQETEERIKAERITAWREGLLELTDIEIYEFGLKVLADGLGAYGLLRFITQHFKHLNDSQSIDQSQQSSPTDSGARTAPNQGIRATDPQD